MDALMIPMIKAPKSQVTAKVDLKSSVGKKTGVNFSDYMEKKMLTERQDKSDLLGLQNIRLITGPAADQKVIVASVEQKKGDDGVMALLTPVSAVNQKVFAAFAPQEQRGEEATAIAALLGQFVQDLQRSASDQKQGLGAWSFPGPDPALLQKLATDAGMNESQMSILLGKMKNKDGSYNLVDFLASFSRHFQTLQNDMPVTVPETDLPLLQSFLERLGVPVPEVSKISEAAVRGDGSFDLQKFIAGLKNLPEVRITDITALEAEQLQDLLAEAGVSQQLQRSLLPERLPVLEGLVKNGPPLTLTLDRLKNMLAQAVDEVKANRLQADPLSFLTDLQEVLARSSFETKGPSLSSAVQGSVVAIFEKLMESVDLSQVKADRNSVVAESMQENKGLLVPVETKAIDLPLLKNLLERLGASVSEVSRISEAAGRGDGTLVLQKVVDLLQVLSGNVITERTEMEEKQLSQTQVFEQLQFLPGNAITERIEREAKQLSQTQVFEQLSVMKGINDSGQTVPLILDSLKNMLAQTVREVKGNRLQTEQLSLLADLQEVLATSDFVTNGQRQSPAAQGSLVAIFEKLMERADLSKIKVQPGVGKLDKVLSNKLEMVHDPSAIQEADTVALLKGEIAETALVLGQPAKNDRSVLASGELFVENSSIFQVEAAVAAKAESVGSVASSTQVARPFVHIPNLPPGLQQQSFAQLSQGVLQGLRNQEHHLVLKLYPKELGEVKVEMMVRDNQVAVSFLMENSRVKAVLESNLEQFRDNMEKQGFTLGECMVSLNRDTDSNESWRQFKADFLEKGSGRRLTTLADLPDDILYQRMQPGNGRESGVDLFA